MNGTTTTPARTTRLARQQALQALLCGAADFARRPHEDRCINCRASLEDVASLEDCPFCGAEN